MATDAIEELRREWEEMKTRVVYILLGGVLALVGYGVWVGQIQTQVSRNMSDIQKNDSRTVIDEARINSIEVINSSTNARLTSIDVALQEIKLAIKQIR